MGLIGYFYQSRHFLLCCGLNGSNARHPSTHPSKDIDNDHARNAKAGPDAGKSATLYDLLKDRPLLVFLICAVLFHFANAAMLPLLGKMFSKGKGRSSMMFMSACVVTTQLTIAPPGSWPPGRIVGPQTVALDWVWSASASWRALHVHARHLPSWSAYRFLMAWERASSAWFPSWSSPTSRVAPDAST